MIIYYTDKFAGSREESRRLLREAAAAYTGDEEQAKTLIGALKTGEHGKPYIEGFCCFSVSHTGSIWAVLFADRECGLDIQLSRKCDIMSISGRFFAPQDAALVASASDPDEETPEWPALHEEASERPEKPAAGAHDTFFRIWTRREALVKAIGGAVYDTDLPAVSYDKVLSGDKSFLLRDISLPGMPDVYAAICIEGEHDVSGLKYSIL